MSLSRGERRQRLTAAGLELAETATVSEREQGHRAVAVAAGKGEAAAIVNLREPMHQPAARRSRGKASDALLVWRDAIAAGPRPACALPSKLELALRGFRDGHGISTALSTIHRLETEADALVRDSVSSLFAAGIDPMMVIRLEGHSRDARGGIDACETAANVLEGASLKIGRRLIRDDLR